MFSFISSFFMANIMKIMIGFAILTVVGSAFIYYNWSQKEIRTLRENSAKLEVAVSIQQDTIASLTDDIEQYKKITKWLANNNAEYRKNLTALQQKFHKNNRDLGNIAKNKPNLVEDIINKATKKSNDCFEQMTQGKETPACN